MKHLGLVLAVIASTAVALGTLGCAHTPRDMVYVPGGVFDMGNHFDGGDSDERPIHAVRLRPFLLGRHEVTIAQFAEFVQSTGYETDAERGEGDFSLVKAQAGQRPDTSWRNPHFEQDDTHPVVCVTWFDAIEYCNWRSVHEGLAPCYTRDGDDVRWDSDANGYRLPTEAEWEYAARSGGKRRRYAWGDGEPRVGGRPAGNTRDEALARTRDLKGYWEGYDDGHAYTAPACAFAPNELGIHDLSGSLYEWCWDWYDETYYQYSPSENPTGPTTGTMRSCRDCGFGCPIYQEELASRGKATPSLIFSWGGFRLARNAVR